MVIDDGASGLTPLGAKLTMILMFSSPRRGGVSGLLAGLSAVAFLLAACGTDQAGSSDANDEPHVVTAFYPLQFAAERVAGGHATVTNLTKAGSEPHDLELTPKDVATLEEAGLVVYLHGFQPAVDDSVEQTAADHALEVTKLADLRPLTAAGAHEDEHAGEHADEGGEPSGHDHDAGTDPHFWLDPLRLAAVADGIAQRLGRVDPAHAEAYDANAAKLRRDLRTLDGEFEAGLATCTGRELVTSHLAFGYLATRYGLDQVGVAGLSPEQEPSPAKLSEVATYVRTHKVRTIYYETLVDPGVASTLAKETGADVAVLDPIEGLTDASAGTDYLSVMRANLATLVRGQSC